MPIKITEPSMKAVGCCSCYNHLKHPVKALEFNHSADTRRSSTETLHLCVSCLGELYLLLDESGLWDK